MSGKLYLVPTPIGNLGDMTYRAVAVLKTFDKILAEDTRTTKVLLNHYEISTTLESFHQHNEHQKLNYLIGLKQMYQLKFDRLWTNFERCIGNKEI